MPLQKILLLFISIVCSFFTQAQINIKNFTRLEYGGGMQNWSIEGDKEGRVYIANNEGLLVGIGNKWLIYPTPNKTIVRSIALDNNGKIYVGGQDEIGYFTPNKTGKLIYVSLLPQITESERQFADVWNVVVVNDVVYFRTSQKIFVLNKNKITIHKTKTQWDFLGAIGSNIIVAEREKGLYYLNGNNLIVNNINKNILPTSITSFKNGSLLTTVNDGLLIIENNVIKKFAIQSSNNADNNQHFTCAKQLADKSILVGTYDNGIYKLDSNGVLLQTFTASNGLNSNNIKCIYQNKLDIFWVGLEDGIAALDMQYNISQINPRLFNGAAGYSAAIYNNKIYFALANGIYTMPLTDNISRLSNAENLKKIANGLSWKLTVINGKLFAGRDDGFYEIKNDALSVIDKNTGFWIFKSLRNNTNTFIAGNYWGISLFDSSINGFKKVKDLSSLNISARYLEVDTIDNTIWISHPYRGVYSVSATNFFIQHYTQNDGLPSTLNNHVFKINNTVVIATINGIYTFNKKSKRFEVSDTYKQFFNNKSIRYLQQDTKGNIWFVENKTVGLVNIATKSITYFNELHQKILSGFENFLLVNNNLLVGAEQGFFYLNANKYLQQKQINNVLFTGITAYNKEDSVLYAGTGLASNEMVVSKKWSSFHFEFSSPFSSQSINTKYAYRLVGFEEEWSGWTYKTEKFYTNLPAGKYKFEVKALNNLNKESAITSFSFKISPPWYNTTWFKILVAVLLIFIIYRIHIYQEARVIKKQEIKQAEERKLYEEKQLMLSYKHQMELEIAEREMMQLKNENLEAELASTAMNLVQKKEFIIRIKDEISKLNKSGKDSIDSSELKKILKRLTAEDKLDDEWDQFSIHFDKVHGSFINNVKKQYPDLKPHELKLCAYIRLNLSSKEIAQLMSISVRGVEISRYRLRKKLQVPAKEDLYKFLTDIAQI